MRVLLVEDEPRLAETVRRGLAAEGFVVDVEHDGVDGLAAAATGDFDVWWCSTSCCPGSADIR